MGDFGEAEGMVGVTLLGKCEVAGEQLGGDDGDERRQALRSVLQPDPI
jgi:hypothetical protein